MVLINDDYYEDLTPETFEKVLDAFARGETPKPGSAERPPVLGAAGRRHDPARHDARSIGRARYDGHGRSAGPGRPTSPAAMQGA